MKSAAFIGILVLGSILAGCENTGSVRGCDPGRGVNQAASVVQRGLEPMDGAEFMVKDGQWLPGTLDDSGLDRLSRVSMTRDIEDRHLVDDWDIFWLCDHASHSSDSHAGVAR